MVDEKFQKSQPKSRRVGVDPARHAVDAQEVHAGRRSG